MPEAVLATIILLPALITYFLRSNAALGYLALCVGFVLSTSVIGDLKHLLSESNLSLTNDTLAIILISLPFTVTLLMSRKAHTKGLSLWVNVLIAILSGGLLALSVVPLLNSQTSFNVLDSSLWTQLSKYQAATIGAGAFLSLITVWLGHTKTHKKH